MKIKSVKTIIAGVLVIPLFMIGINLLSPPAAFADPALNLNSGADAAKGTGTPKDLFKKEKESDPDPIFKTIANAALYIIGAVSVLMLIYGGVRYTISGGDEKSVTAAKNTIIYSVVGIIVAVMSYAIVNFVITNIK